MSNADAGPTLWFEGDVDHVNPEKFDFRAAALRYDARRTKMLELYAGTGYLSSRVYAGAYPSLVMVEEDKGNFRRLVRRVGRLVGVQYYNKNNADFIKYDLENHLDFSALDLDDWGIPTLTLQAFLAAIAGKCAQTFLLALTDGGLMAARRRVPLNIGRYYLTGDDETRPFPRRWARDFESFQSDAVARIACKYGFNSRAVGMSRNHNQTVLYSAYAVTPLTT